MIINVDEVDIDSLRKSVERIRIRELGALEHFDPAVLSLADAAEKLLHALTDDNPREQP